MNPKSKKDYKSIQHEKSKDERKRDKMQYEAIYNKNETYKNLFTMIPKYLVREVFYYLDWPTLCKMKVVCRHWKLLIEHPFFEAWKKQTQFKKPSETVHLVASEFDSAVWVTKRKSMTIEEQEYQHWIKIAVQLVKKYYNVRATLCVEKKTGKPYRSKKSSQHYASSKKLFYPTAKTTLYFFYSKGLIPRITQTLVREFINYCEQQDQWQEPHARKEKFHVKPEEFGGQNLLGEDVLLNLNKCKEYAISGCCCCFCRG